MKAQARYSALIVALLGMIGVAIAVYFYFGIGLRHRIVGHWSGSDPASFVKVSWNGQCSFRVSGFSGVGRGKFKRDKASFQMVYHPPDRHPGRPLAILLSTTTCNGDALQRKELEVNILEVAPWYWPSIYFERLTRRGEQVGVSGEPPQASQPQN